MVINFLQVLDEMLSNGGFTHAVVMLMYLGVVVYVDVGKKMEISVTSSSRCTHFSSMA